MTKTHAQTHTHVQEHAHTRAHKHTHKYTHRLILLEDIDIVIERNRERYRKRMTEKESLWETYLVRNIVMVKDGETDTDRQIESGRDRERQRQKVAETERGRESKGDLSC